MAKSKSASTLKVKKKRWVSIVAPKMFHNQVVGESYVVDTDTLVGRIAKVNLMTVTNDIKKQNMYITLKINEIRDANAQTAIIGYNTIPASIKRMVRRNRNKLDDSFICKTSDGVYVRIKTIMLTRSKARGSATRALVNANRLAVASYVNKIKYEVFVNDVLTNKFQRGLKMQFSKIYPLKTYDVREFLTVDGKINPNSVVTADEKAMKEAQEKIKEEAQEEAEIEETEAETSKE